MSLKKSNLLLLILVGSAILGVYQYLQSPRIVKQNFAHKFNVSQYSSRGVVDRIIQLKFKTKKLSKTKSEIIAFVSLPFDFEGSLQYKWTLGQNLTLVEDSLTGFSDSKFQKDKTQKIKITVNGFDPSQLRHIGFEIWGDKNGRRLFADGLISSQQENSFEDVVQNVEKIKAKKLGIPK